MTQPPARPVAFCEACHTAHSEFKHTICPDCVEELKQLLGDVRALLDELNTTLSRQTRIGGATGGRTGSEFPLPYDPAASEAADVLLAHTITRWALDIWRHAKVVGGQSWGSLEPPTDPVVFLLGVVDQIKTRRYAATLLDEVRSAVENARMVIDLAQDYLEAGACEKCSQRLRGRPGDLQIECRRCGAVYDLQERRQDMLAAAEDRWLTAKDCERMVEVLMRLGESERIRKRIPAGSVRGWASKGQIEAQGLTLDGNPTYRLGDVLDRALRALLGSAA